jgi:hypothetical protein
MRALSFFLMSVIIPLAFLVLDKKGIEVAISCFVIGFLLSARLYFAE